MTKRMTITCKIIGQRGWNDKEIGEKFEIINPFGRQGSGANDPEDVMVLKWLCPNGTTYTFRHLYNSRYEEEKPDNTATISAKCGQSQEIELNDIDENQDISEVTIRGVTYVPK